MLQYSANDIMERAEQYANKESSSVYSYPEKVSMLNEAWQELYQILVNTGDKYWIKTFTFEGDSVELPKDLYQIATVKRNNEPITNYELNNNHLIFKTSGTYEVEYYPTPKTLYFKMKMKKSMFQPPKSNEASYEYKYKGGKDGTYIYNKKATSGSTSDRRVFIYNSVSKTTDTVSFSGTDAMLYDNAILGYTEYYSFKNGEKKLFNGNPVIFNNNLFFYENGKIKDDTGKEVTEYTPDENITGYFKLVTSDFINFKPIYGGNIKTLGDDFVYINSSNQLIYVDKDGNESLVYTRYQPMGFEDNMLITYDNLSKLYFNESIYNDTIISYPSNVYITILALNIAMKMRAKQGIDNEQLNAQYSMAMTNLYNTIDRDKNKNLVIKDVYNTNTYGSIFK